MDVLVGTNATLWVDFTGPTGLLVADVGTVNYTIYNQYGVALVLNQPLSVPADTTGVSVPLLSSYNTIAAGKSFEKRTVAVAIVSGGQSLRVTKSYRIVPIPLYTASPDDVRTFLGLNDDELTDSEVDIFEAYLKLQAQITEPVLTASLTSGTYLENQANEAIYLTAVIKLIPSLQLRVGQELSEGSDKFKRFSAAVPDWATLLAQAQGRLNTITTALDPVVVTTVDPTFIIFATTVDAITGV